jgi:hypothetical protein
MMSVLITGGSSGFGLETALLQRAEAEGLDLQVLALDVTARAGGDEVWVAATTEVFASVAGPRPAPAAAPRPDVHKLR